VLLAAALAGALTCPVTATAGPLKPDATAVTQQPGPALDGFADPTVPRRWQDAALQQGLTRVMRETGLDGFVRAGTLAVALVDITEGQPPRLAMLNGDRMMYAASLPKIAILLGALVEAESGRFPLDPERVAAMTAMIRHSSNVDATRVLNWIGGDRLLQILESPRFALYDRRGDGGLWVGKAYGGEPAFRRDPVANLSHGATAYQVARLYSLLAQGVLLSPRMNDLMLEILSRPAIRHKFVLGLASRPGATLWRKSGTWKQAHADSALVESDGRRFVIVGLADSPDGGEWLRRLAEPLHDLIVSPPGKDATPGTH
jgi:beta-lactamase class A